MKALQDELTRQMEDLRDKLYDMKALQDALIRQLRYLKDRVEVLEPDLDNPSRKGSSYKNHADYIAAILADRTRQGGGGISRAEIADLLLGKPVERGINSTLKDRQQEYKRRQRWLNRFVNHLKDHPEMFRVERDRHDKRIIIVSLNPAYFRSHGSELLTDFTISKLQPAIYRKRYQR